MTSLQLMRSKAAAIALPMVLAAAIAGCGESTPKRAVDARTEVVRFFAVDAPVVAVLHPEPQADVVALNRAADGTPAWTSLRGMVLGPLHTAGLGRTQIDRLVRTNQPIEGVAASALALGAATPADLAAHDPLLVLATDQAELLSRLLGRAAAKGKLRRAGQLHEATLYRGPGYAYAVRDGVLVSGNSLADVRTAIERRDGDSDKQLDEDVVDSLFNGLTTQGPLLVYANLNHVRKADPGLRTLGQQAPWTGLLGPTAATAQAVDGSLRIEEFSNTTGGEFSSGDLPLGTEPSRFAISVSGAASLLPPGPTRMLLAGLAPMSGEATASPDQVRLQLTAGR
jgi:hypothetical protein